MLQHSLFQALHFLFLFPIFLKVLVGYNYKNMLDTLDTLYKHRFITEYEYRNYLTNLKKEFDKKKKHIFLSGN